MKRYASEKMNSMMMYMCGMCMFSRTRFSGILSGNER